MIRKTLSLLSLTAIGFFSAFSYAENLQIEGTFGVANLSKSGYTSGENSEISIAYTTPNIFYRVGGTYIGGFSLSEDRDHSDVNIGGIFAGVGNTFDLGFLDMDIEGGLLYSKLEASYQGRDLDEQNDTSPYLTVKFEKRLPKLVGIHLGYKYINDLSGSDINLIQAGVRFHF
ncbi:hypothetical protein [Teredinibacter sp. KSP-S5-2]|uniref:hypothetical protein n=1 Tax=Teredinibacter sp. KSP-S5-2 TaxID=3034506 RepID=UPI002935069C|nr:hypothetical protein [Teredinibacter sp. KSP-S5-2]WNO10143.1 hypothetical protein P5V12_03055 [Teredinibacter sp. KSP-S5-2]